MSQKDWNHLYDQVIRLHYVLGCGPTEISRTLSVSRHYVYSCITIFAKKNPEKAKLMRKEKTKLTRKSVQAQSVKLRETIEGLEARVKELERQLSDERLRSEAYDTMIDIAEETFNIPIRKKPGAEQ